MSLQMDLDKSKIGIISKGSTFLSTILFSLKFNWSTEVPTAATNGINLLVNKDYFQQLTPQERMGLLAHEAWHVAFKHMDRLGDREYPMIWNMAADYVINPIVINSGFVLPKGALIDHGFYNMSTEEVYERLLAHKIEPPEDMMLDLQMAGDGSEEDNTTIQNEIDNIIIKATIQSEQAGEDPSNIPENIRRYVKELLDPKVNWHVLLQSFLQDKINEDYTWRRPNKRFFPDYHLPSQISEGLSHISIAVDASGSVTDEQFSDFITEIAYIHQTFKPKKLTILEFDTEIKNIHTLTEYDSVSDIKFEGYGGTNITPVIDWGVKNSPNALVIFTDGYFERYEPDVGFPILWLIYDNKEFTSNIGEVIEYS